MPEIGLNRHASPAELKAEADDIWQKYWVEDLTRNGDVDLELVKAELAGYHHLQLIVSTVYDELSGGQISKPGYNDTDQIIGCIREVMELEAQDDVIDALHGSLVDEDLLEGSLVRSYILEVCQALDIDPTKVLSS